MRISDWSSDVCSSELTTIIFVSAPDAENPLRRRQWTAKGTNRKQNSTLAGTPERRATLARGAEAVRRTTRLRENAVQTCRRSGSPPSARHTLSARRRSEEHTSELQSLMRISYALLRSKQKNHITNYLYRINQHLK